MHTSFKFESNNKPYNFKNNFGAINYLYNLAAQLQLKYDNM